MYNVGDMITVYVNRVSNYGAFVICEDKKTEGLLHISKISSSRVRDIRRHVKMGDTFNAKILGIDEQGRLELTTIGMPMPNYDIIEEDPTLQRETQKIISHLEKVVGPASVKAKQELSKLVERYGIVDVTMKLAERVRSFENDLSLVLAKQIKTDLIDEFTTYEVDCTKHACEQFIDRVGGETLEEANTHLRLLVQTGSRIESKDEDHIYIQNEQLVFPCLVEDQKLIVKTVLTKDMYNRTA